MLPLIGTSPALTVVDQEVIKPAAGIFLLGNELVPIIDAEGKRVASGVGIAIILLAGDPVSIDIATERKQQQQ